MTILSTETKVREGTMFYILHSGYLAAGKKLALLLCYECLQNGVVSECSSSKWIRRRESCCREEAKSM